VGNSDVLDITVHQNVRLSDLIVSKILESDELPIIFHKLDHVKIRNKSEPVEISRYCERFQSLTSELMSPIIEIKSGIEADKAARDFTAYIALAYRLSTNKITLSIINNDVPGLDRLLQKKQRLQKLWQDTRDPARQTAVSWV
jgi:hypothetical protein